MKKLKIEAGKFYRTRDGRKAGIYRTNVNPPEDSIHGYVIELNGGEYPRYWDGDGAFIFDGEHGYDLIEEWQEPLDFDWDCLPKWCNKYIAMDVGGIWYSYSNEPTLGTLGFYVFDIITAIPKEYHPKNFKGDWKDSLFKNPNLD